MSKKDNISLKEKMELLNYFFKDFKKNKKETKAFIHDLHAFKKENPDFFKDMDELDKEQKTFFKYTRAFLKKML